MNVKLIFLITWILGIFVFGVPIVSAVDVGVTGDKFSNVQDSIDSANTGDIIKLSNKTYTAINSSDQIIVDNKNLIIQGPSANSFATLDAQNLCRIFWTTDDAIVTFKYITFINGNRSGGSGTAIDAHNKIIVDNYRFINNKGESGSAIILGLNSNYSSIINSQFIGNKGIYPSTDNWVEGGAIDVHASHTTIKNCVFKDNYAMSVGGAVNFAGGTVAHELLNCTFINNSAVNAGALYVANTTLSIENCIFENNSATNGGAIYSNNGLNIIFSSFDKNSAIQVEEVFILGVMLLLVLQI